MIRIVIIDDHDLMRAVVIRQTHRNPNLPRQRFHPLFSRTDSQHRHFDLFLFDLLTEVLGRPAHHQAGDEHCQNAIEQDSVKAGPHTAENHLTGHDVEHRNQASQRRVAVVHTVDGTATGVRSHRGK